MVAPARFLIIGNPHSERVALFQQALRQLGLPAAAVVDYRGLIAGSLTLTDFVQAGTVIRIESPGKDWPTEQALLSLGAEVEDQDEILEETHYARLSKEQVLGLEFEKGAIRYPRQWYLGYRRLLEKIKTQLAACPPHQLMLDPADIATMFDKRACHALLLDNQVKVPPALGPVRSYEELLGRMYETNFYRVFVKLAHGSSGSGVVAFQASPHLQRQQATTTVEMVKGPQGLKLYNSRRLQTYTEPGQIAGLIGALCQHRVQVEKWLPKASWQGQNLDLRVVMIQGKACQVVVRRNQGPITNLHLNPNRSAGRADLAALAGRLSPPAWQAARQTCEKVMQLYPKSLYAGIDLLISSNFKQHAVAEVNCFGDLLYGALYHQKDPYTLEIEASLA